VEPPAPASAAPEPAADHVRARRRVGAVALALVAVAILIYARTARFESLDFDDGEYVFANPNVLSGFTASGVRWAFTAFYAANWHPLTWMSHMLDIQLFGANPGPHHLVNAAIHAANAAILFLVLRAATSAFWPSALVAALFAVHPLNVESVAWISQRKSVLSTLFLFLTIGAYVAWTRKGGSGRRLLVGVLLGLGLLSKSMLVTAPLLLLVVDFWPLRRLDGRARLRPLIIEKAPLFLLVAAASAATFLAQSRDNAVAEVSRYPIGSRIANALVSTVLYLRDAVWPAKLACFYPHPATLGETIGGFAVVGSAALLGGITALAWASRRTRPWLLFGWAWYLVSLVPVIGLVQVGSQARADRYAYVPLVGIFVAVVWEAAERVRRSAALRGAAAAAAGVVIATLAGTAFVQVGYWRDAGTLYTHALAVTRNNWLASNNLGNFWISKGDLPRAMACFREAIAIKPDYDQAWYNQGVVFMNTDRPLEAIASYRRSLALDASNSDGWVNLGFTLVNLGRFPEALQAYETALSLRPEDPMALHGAALARAGVGDPVAAEDYLRRLQKIDPGSAARARAELRSLR
jgi:Tfp pilus assembly protein PilF